jgi:hypothetical protein
VVICGRLGNFFRIFNVLLNELALDNKCFPELEPFEFIGTNIAKSQLDMSNLMHFTIDLHYRVEHRS